MGGAAGYRSNRPQLVGTSTATPTLTDTTTKALSVPSGVENGDLLVAALFAGGGAASGWDLPGFVLVVSDISAAPNMALGYRVAASEPASYTMTTTLARKLGGTMLAFRGAAYDAVSSGGGTNGISSGVTASSADSLLLGFWGIDQSSVTFSTPSGMTSIAGYSDSYSGLFSPNWEIFSQSVEAGATGTRQSLVNGTPTNCSAKLLVIKPN